jgi:hypothetical protein
MKKNSFHFLTCAAALAALSTPVAFATDNETSATSNTTKNPITGTVKTEKVAKHKRTHGDGSVSEKKDTSTIKHKTDGSVETKSIEETSDAAK